MPDATTAPSEEVSHGVFEILASSRRRMVLRLLHEKGDREGVWDLGGISTHIAAHEADIRAAAVTDRQRKRVWIALYQQHLPKLHDGGFIHWDQTDNTITPMAWTRGLLPLMQDLEMLEETREYDEAARDEADGAWSGWRLRDVLRFSTSTPGGDA